MRKIALIATSILCIGSCLMSSSDASMMGEDIAGFKFQYPAKNFDEDARLQGPIRSAIITKKNYERMLAVQLNRLDPYNFLSHEEKLATRFKIGEIYYEYAENTKDLDDKAALLEQAKIHLEASQFSEAKDYLEKIAIFDETYEQ